MWLTAPRHCAHSLPGSLPPRARAFGGAWAPLRARALHLSFSARSARRVRALGAQASRTSSQASFSRPRRLSPTARFRPPNEGEGDEGAVPEEEGSSEGEEGAATGGDK